MSYSIYIGEAELEIPDKQAIDDCNLDRENFSLYAHVQKINLPDAPIFPGDQMTGNSNGRHPGYSQWSDFCKEAGIYEVFYGEDENERDGLLGDHPGCFLLLPWHLDAIKEAKRKRSMTLFAGVEPGWCNCSQCDRFGKKETVHVNRDATLARLIWLEWWMEWALKNCKIPAVYNH